MKRFKSTLRFLRMGGFASIATMLNSRGDINVHLVRVDGKGTDFSKMEQSEYGLVKLLDDSTGSYTSSQKADLWVRTTRDLDFNRYEGLVSELLKGRTKSRNKLLQDLQSNTSELKQKWIQDTPGFESCTEWLTLYERYGKKLEQLGVGKINGEDVLQKVGNLLDLDKVNFLNQWLQEKLLTHTVEKGILGMERRGSDYYIYTRHHLPIERSLIERLAELDFTPIAYSSESRLREVENRFCEELADSIWRSQEIERVEMLHRIQEKLDKIPDQLPPSGRSILQIINDILNTPYTEWLDMVSRGLVRFQEVTDIPAQVLNVLLVLGVFAAMMGLIYRFMRGTHLHTVQLMAMLKADFWYIVRGRIAWAMTGLFGFKVLSMLMFANYPELTSVRELVLATIVAIVTVSYATKEIWRYRQERREMREREFWRRIKGRDIRAKRYAVFGYNLSESISDR